MAVTYKRLDEKRTVPKRPTIRPEREWAEACGGALVAGVDEAGRGPLAGPVVAAAVILPFDGRRPIGLRDSKQMPQAKRDKLFRQIQRMAVSFGVGVATAQEIDALNILEATRLAARRALDCLDPQPTALVTDYLHIPNDTRPTLAMVKGDAISSSVAAASILAKVTRDRLMDAYDQEFPEFGWAKNRGYPTPDHYAALESHGPTILHRLSFNGVGFFETNPRRSPTFERYAKLIRECKEGDDGQALLAMIDEIAELGDKLPPPDARELVELCGGDQPATFG